MLALTLAVAVLLLKGQGQTPTAGDRFLIVQGDYVAVSGNNGIAEKGVFRIDTTTGKTWRFAAGLGRDGKFYQMWQPVQE
jgi:hypothetical protein